MASEFSACLGGRTVRTLAGVAVHGGSRPRGTAPRRGVDVETRRSPRGWLLRHTRARSVGATTTSLDLKLSTIMWALHGCPGTKDGPYGTAALKASSACQSMPPPTQGPPEHEQADGSHQTPGYPSRQSVSTVGGATPHMRLRHLTASTAERAAARTLSQYAETNQDRHQTGRWRRIQDTSERLLSYPRVAVRSLKVRLQPLHQEPTASRAGSGSCPTGRHGFGTGDIAGAIFPSQGMDRSVAGFYTAQLVYMREGQH